MAVAEVTDPSPAITISDSARKAIHCAIGHPVRFKILHYLTEYEKLSPKDCVVVLAERNETNDDGDPWPLGTVSYHVRTLKEVGLIRAKGTVPRRGAVEHYYGLSKLGQSTIEHLSAITG